MKTNCLLIHKDDNVVVALKPLAKGETITVGGETILVKADIPAGHKIACRPIGKGENIIKYGHPIGHATAEIPAGEWVHSHNLETNLSGTLDYAYRPERPQLPRPEAGGVLLAGEASFNGYVRENGDVGIRNEIWVLNTVGCINKTAETIARIADARFSDKGRPEPRGIDGVYHFPHPFGCSQLGDDLLNTQKILAGLVHHPNAGGVLVLGLGCENNNINEFKKVLGDFDERRIKFLEMQEVEDETAKLALWKSWPIMPPPLKGTGPRRQIEGGPEMRRFRWLFRDLRQPPGGSLHRSPPGPRRDRGLDRGPGDLRGGNNLDGQG